MPVWRYEGNKVWEYIILAKCLSNCCQLKFYFLAISILVLGSRGLNCLKHHTVVEVEWRCHRCAKNKGTTFLRLHPSNIGDEIDVDEDGDLNGEKNETTAKHPSDIVTAVNVFGYSPGSRQLTSQQKGKEKGKTVCYSQKRENYLLFSRNSSGRRTVNGSLSGFTSSTTIAMSVSWSGCKILQDWGQSHSSGLFRKGGPGHPPQMKTCSDMHEHDSPKHETSSHLESVIWNKS